MTACFDADADGVRCTVGVEGMITIDESSSGLADTQRNLQIRVPMDFFGTGCRCREALLIRRSFGLKVYDRTRFTGFVEVAYSDLALPVS